MKGLLVRTLLNLITSPFSIDNSELKFPANYRYFDGIPPADILKEVIHCYQELFSKPPWNERWETRIVKEKLIRELRKDHSFLTIMFGDEEFPIAGFSWGAIIKRKTIAERIAFALSTSITKNNYFFSKLEKYLKKRKIDRVLYFDELGILKKFRSGTNPLKFLTIGGFEKARKEGIKQAIFWSTPQSKIVPIMKMMGFEEIAKIKVGKKEIVFLFSPNFFPVLKISKSLSHEQTSKVLKLVSSLIV